MLNGYNRPAEDRPHKLPFNPFPPRLEIIYKEFVVKYFLILATALIAIQLSACGNLQNLQKPEIPDVVKGSNLRLTTERPDKEAVFRAHAVPDKSVFVRQNTGGSAAAGILLGPLGGLLNSANIERINKEMAESGKNSTFYQIDALEEASLALGMEPQDLSLGSAVADTIVLQPRLVLFGGDDRKTLYTVLVVRAEKNLLAQQGDSKTWTAYYYYVAEPTYSLERIQEQLSPEERTRFLSSIHAGFSEIKTEMLRDLSGNLPKMKIANVKSPALGAENHMLGAIGGFGDIEQSPGGRLVLRMPVYSWGGSWSKWASHVVWIFPLRNQYSFEDGPVEREERK